MRRRLAQRARAYRIKPWLQAKGPRTVQGRARAAQNARKHGSFDARRKALSRVLSRQSRFIRAVHFYRHGPLPPWLIAAGRQVTDELLLAYVAMVADNQAHES